MLDVICTLLVVHACTLPLRDYKTARWFAAHAIVNCLLTDPTYGYDSQLFRTSKGSFDEKVLAFHLPTRRVYPLLPVSSLQQPNGILLSPDNLTCYITDVWDPERFPHIANLDMKFANYVYKFDVSVSDDKKVQLGNKTLFYAPKLESGFPDGIKCDSRGTIYVGCGDGVHVLNKKGTLIQRIHVPGGVSNLAFGGPCGTKLLLLNGRHCRILEGKERGGLRQGY